MKEKGKDIHELYIKGLERFKKKAEKACPYNVPIQPMLLMAHQQLTLA